jgi:hypothetical protein
VGKRVQEQAGHKPLPLEEVALDELKPHKRNYRTHPDDEIEHLMESIQSNGVYRNIVVAQDGTIIAGHGVALAARKLGLTHIPVYRTEYGPDDPRALKLLVSDNEISHLAESDDRLLTKLLRELKDFDLDLLGTGYDDMMLANLLMVTRPASEIADLEAAAQWVGMPEYDMESKSGQIQIIVNFANEEDRKEFCHLLSLDADKIPKSGTGKSIWWPKPRENMDSRSIRFVSKDNEND